MEFIKKLSGKPAGCIYQTIGLVSWVKKCKKHENCGTFKTTNGAYVLEPLAAKSSEMCDYWSTMAQPSNNMGQVDVVGALSWGSSSDKIVNGGEPLVNPACETVPEMGVVAAKNGPSTAGTCDAAYQRVVDTANNEISFVKCHWNHKTANCEAGAANDVSHCYDLGSARPTATDSSAAKLEFWEASIASASLNPSQEWWAKFGILALGLA